MTQDIGKTYTVYLDSQGNVLGVDLKPVSDIGVVTSVNIALVTGTTNQYVVAYNVLMPDGSNVTVYGVDPNTQKPYTSAANAQAAANAFWNENANPAPVLVNGENKDAGILARITPIANGYYRVVAAGTVGNRDANNSYVGTLAPNRVLERGEANAFWLANLTNTFNATSTGSNYPAYIGGVGPTTINNVLVDDTTVYFVANYDYNYTADEYQFKNFTISEGFKSIMDLSYDNTQPNASTAPGSATGSADIDGQPQASLNLEVSAFDTDTDGYADFVLVLNANKQQEPTPVTVLNYAYLMNNRRFASTSIDQNVFGAIIDGVADQRLTLTAVASQSVLDTGLYTYANQTINGWSAVNFVSPSTATATGNPVWGIAATTGAQGWLVKDDVLVVDPNNNTVVSSMDRGQYNPTTGTTFNPPVADKFLTLADDCKVFLVNPTTGSSTPQPYDLSTLDNTDVYGTNEIVYQFDANGYVNLIYIVAKGGPETNRDPATQIQSLTWTPSATEIVPGRGTDWTGDALNVTGANGNYVDIADENVSITCEWQYLNTNASVAKWETAGANFVAGYTYRLKVTMTADNGYVFASNLVVTNPFSNMTQSAPVFENNNKTATLYYTPNTAVLYTLTVNVVDSHAKTPDGNVFAMTAADKGAKSFRVYVPSTWTQNQVVASASDPAVIVKATSIGTIVNYTVWNIEVTGMTKNTTVTLNYVTGKVEAATAANVTDVTKSDATNGVTGGSDPANEWTNHNWTTNPYETLGIKTTTDAANKIITVTIDSSKFTTATIAEQAKLQKDNGSNTTDTTNTAYVGVNFTVPAGYTLTKFSSDGKAFQSNGSDSWLCQFYKIADAPTTAGDRLTLTKGTTTHSMTYLAEKTGADTIQYTWTVNIVVK